MSSNITLGQILTGNEGRDAVHVAIAPCVAKEKLYPGQDVGADGTTAQPHVGIVDPYLKHPVLPEQGFWLCLYPNTVTSLRHEWEHPAFPATEKTQDGSVAWLTDFAATFGMTYDAVIEAAKEWLNTGEWTWLNYDTPDRAWTDRVLFWQHFENATGIEVPEDDKGSTFFTCSC